MVSPIWHRKLVVAVDGVPTPWEDGLRTPGVEQRAHQFRAAGRGRRVAIVGRVAIAAARELEGVLVSFVGPRRGAETPRFVDGGHE
jgi:hypothetical protein